MEASLGFSEAWFASGVMNRESAAAFARYAAADPAKPARYWRWLAFRDRVEELTPLTAEQCRAFFALAGAEPDDNLAAAIVCCILYQPACPVDLRESAEASRHSAASRIAARVKTRSPCEPGATGGSSESHREMHPHVPGN